MNHKQDGNTLVLSAGDPESDHDITLPDATGTVLTSPYALHPTPYALHLTPYNRHPTPYSLLLTPYTLHPTPYTSSHTTYNIDNKPETRKLQTLHPESETRNPDPKP